MYITKEEITRALRICGNSRKCTECPLGDVEFCLHIMTTCATDLIEQQTARIAELEAKVPRWIPVTERLPEAKEGNLNDIARVLVTVQPYCFFTDEPETPYVTSAVYDIEQRIFDVGGLGAVNAVLFESDKPRLTITHWMPLPEAAKEV